MTLDEYRKGLKAYYLEHEHEFAEAYSSMERWLRDVMIENAYKKTLPQTVDFHWFDGNSRIDYQNWITGLDEYGFTPPDAVKFSGPFSDIVE